MQKTSILICGAGIIGLTIARQLVKTGRSDIVIMDKETDLGRHASGRNSGVLHAGIYYDPGTLKARHCLRGNFKMREYCKEKGLPLLESGKVIVARTEDELPTLHTLHDRAVENGAKVELISEKRLADVEPNAKTSKEALLSHYTAVVDPKKILEALRRDLLDTGKVRFMLGSKFLGRESGNVAATSTGPVGYEMFINAAGAYSDKVAKAFGVGLEYRLIPFKGIYKKLGKKCSDMIRGSIYPVPNIKNPFLGIHFTRNVYGDVYLGPTAIPALSRENYGIVKGLDLEFPEILYRDAVLFMKNKKFRGVALDEPRKYFFKYFFSDAKKLVKHLEPSYIEDSPKVGIRPQLVDIEKNELVMDFIVKKSNDSVHVLNSISPAFTSSMHFAEIVVDTYI